MSKELDCAAFLTALHGNALTALPDARVVIWTSDKGKQAQRFDDCADAAECAIELSDSGMDVFHGCSVMPSKGGGRGKAADALALSALWADIDIAVEGKAKEYPPTLEDARAVVGLLGMPPSITVETGGGLHMYWLLAKPMLAGAGEGYYTTDYMASMTQRWQGMIRRGMRDNGWELDSTHDLARVLRPPETTNHKYGHAVTAVLHGEKPIRYDYEDILARLPEPEAAQGNALPVKVGFFVAPPKGSKPQIPAIVNSLMELDPDFTGVWEGQKKFETDSERDLSIATRILGVGGSEQDAVDAVAYRRLTRCVGKKAEKAYRQDYMDATIRKAASGIDQEEGFTEISSGGVDTSTDEGKAKALEAIRRAIRIPLKRFIKIGKGDGCRYAFELDSGERVEIGSSAILLTVRSVQQRIFDATSVVMPAVKAGQWATVVQSMTQVMEEVEGDGLYEQLDSLYEEYIHICGDSPPVKGVEDDAQIFWEQFRTGRPVVADGKVCVTSLGFADFVESRTRNIKMGSLEVQQYLNARGFRKERSSAAKGGERLYRRHWAKPWLKNPEEGEALDAAS